MNATSPSTQSRALSQARSSGRGMPAILLGNQVAFILLSALGFGIVVAAVVIGIDLRSEVTGSIWEPASNAGPWFAAFLAGYLVYQHVPMMVANGFTRRDALGDVGIVIGAQALTLTLMVSLGYLIEYVVYRWQDWPRGIGGDHLFTRHTQVGTIFWETLLTMLMWSAVGAFIGAAFYRYGQEGWLAFIPAIFLNTVVGIFITTRSPFFNVFLEDALPDWGRSLGMATVAVVLGVLASVTIVWCIVRDMPLRRWNQ